MAGFDFSSSDIGLTSTDVSPAGLSASKAAGFIRLDKEVKGRVFSIRYKGFDNSVKRLVFVRTIYGSAFDKTVMFALQPAVREAKRIVVKRTGALARSIHAFIITSSPVQVHAGFGSFLGYALDIELGRSAVNPNGYLRPAWAAKQHIFRARLFAGAKALQG